MTPNVLIEKGVIKQHKIQILANNSSYMNSNGHEQLAVVAVVVDG